MMKKIYLLLFLFSGTFLFGQIAGESVFINEIHYDNVGTDTGEGVEIAGPAGTDLTGWSLVAYNGNGGASYATIVLDGNIIPNEGGSGFGALFFAIPGFQNGAPDGIALFDGTNVEFLSYEGTFVAVGGPADGLTSIDIGVSENNTTTLVGQSLQLIGTGSLSSDFTVTGPVAESPGMINANQTFSASLDPSVTILTPANGTTFPPGTPNVNATLSVQNFTVATPSAGDGFIKYTVDSGAPVDKFDTNAISLVLASGAHTVVVELVDNAGASLSPAATSTVNFTIADFVNITDIATLRTQPTGATNFYKLSGEAILTFQVASRNQKFLQDATGAILVDDQPGTVTTLYEQGDGISGFKGTLTTFAGVLEFVPFENTNAATSNDNSINNQVVTIDMLNTNVDAFESEIVRLENVTFVEGDGLAIFAGSTNYNITDGVNTMRFRTQYPESGLNGTVIPTTPQTMDVIVSENNGVAQVIPFFIDPVSGFTLSEKDFSFGTASFKVYPNPVSTGIVNIVSPQNGSKTVAVFDILGKQMLRTQLNGTTLDVSQLNNGIYILKIEEDGKTTSKKLIVQK